MSTNNKKPGLGLLGVLQIVFIVLKLTDNLDWNWFWVLSPTILPIFAFIAFIVIATIAIVTGVGLGIWDIDRISKKFKKKNAEE
jgi:hypothetical protein